MERERAQYYARSIGNGLLVAAAVLAVMGMIVIITLGNDLDSRFGLQPGSPRIEDYLWVLWPLTVGLVTVIAIVGGLGLYFRWLAVEQDAKMAEFDMLLDALGVPVEDEAGDQPEETRPDA
jgi:hypothetical protein